MEQMRAGLVSLMFGNFYEKKLGDFLFVIQSVISVNSLAEEGKKRDYGFVLFPDFNFPLVKFLRFQRIAFSSRPFFIHSPRDGNLCAARPSDILLLSCNSLITSIEEFPRF